MGCDDYYDPSRDREDRLWRENCATIEQNNMIRHYNFGSDFAVCNECGTVVWTGELRRVDALPCVEKHRQWHAERSQQQ